MNDVTRILGAAEHGDAEAINALLPLVYEELRLLAVQKLSHERPGQTLQATALVHEAYLRLVGIESQNWRCRAHFFNAAAEAMRRILIENARRKGRLKRGAGLNRLDLDQAEVGFEDGGEDLIALDEALAKLEAADKTKAELVKLRYFAGLTLEQASEVLGISPSTAKRHWAYARAWLYRAVRSGP
jgi:RNA polymerase sigma factor (TIGR02999 family)